ncbi:MAG: hypothetical protein ACTHLN_02970, partial [Tepidisphaeraceae bacterium]
FIVKAFLNFPSYVDTGGHMQTRLRSPIKCVNVILTAAIQSALFRNKPTRPMFLATFHLPLKGAIMLAAKPVSLSQQSDTASDSYPSF